MEQNEKILKLLIKLKTDLLEDIEVSTLSQKNLELLASVNSNLAFHINTLKNEKQ